jgi:hypothetical protein
MAIGGFLQGLGLAIGNDMIQGQAYDMKQAQTELLKTEAQKAQMQQQQMQQQMKTQKDIGAFIKSQTDLEGADAALPMNQAKMYSKAAGLAASQGDLASAKEMTELSKQASAEGIEQTKQLAAVQAQKRETLATIADNTPEQPTREQSQALVKAAVEAGVDPTTIPLAGTPAFLAWKNQQQLAGMDSTKKAEFVQKAADTKQRRDQQWAEHEDNVSLRRATLQQTAAFREDSLALRKDEFLARQQDRQDKKAKDPQIVDIGGVKYERDPEMKLKGDRNPTDPTLVKLGDRARTASQENNIVSIGGAGSEVVRNLKSMSLFPTGTTNSPFAHITDHGFVESIEKTGSNALTPEQIQMFQTSSSGLSTELSRIMTLGGGRGANQSVINEVKSQTTPNAGDTNMTAAYKIATAAQIALTRLKATPDPADPKVRANWDETVKELEAYPKPDDILAAASGKQKQQLQNMEGNYRKLLNTVKDSAEGSATPLPGGADPGKGTSAPPLPAGWSVKVHQ